MALSGDSAAPNRNGENQIDKRSGPRRQIELLNAGIGGESLGWGEGEQVRTHFLNMAHGLLFSCPCSASDEAEAAARQGDLERSRGGEEMLRPMPRCTARIGAARRHGSGPSSSVCGLGFFLGVWAGLLPPCAGWALLDPNVLRAAHSQRTPWPTIPSQSPAISHWLRAAANVRSRARLRAATSQSALLFVFLGVPVCSNVNTYQRATTGDDVGLCANKIRNKKCCIFRIKNPNKNPITTSYLLRQDL
jgi:hypothetical protein